MKILVIGGSGLVGWNMLHIAHQAGHESIGTYHQHPFPKLVPLSLSDTSAVNELLQSTRPDAVVNASAWSWVDGCETDPKRAYLENSELPARLAAATHKIGASFVHISSSYVFDGASGPYSEEDLPSPISVYGQSKLAGELAVRDATHDRSLVIRTMGVYGEEPQRKNFVYQVVRNLSEGKRMKIPIDQLGNATYSPDIASGILRLLTEQKTGLWNLAGPQPNLPRSKFAELITDAYQLDSSLLDLVTTDQLHQLAPRPEHGGLTIAKASEHINFEPKQWFPISI